MTFKHSSIYWHTLGFFLSPLLLANLCHAQVVADRSASGDKQAVILSTASGVTQIDIRSPNRRGVSLNHYSRFDVTGQGVILNNGRQRNQTQIGGWVDANPQLAAGSADVIVNQVNSSRASRFHSALEVAGKRADVILANPGGIEVNGGVAINANRLTLTTGAVQHRNGAVSGFDVSEGHISVRGKGLNAEDSRYTQLLSRSAEVNAKIHAKSLTIATGHQRLDSQGQVTGSVSATGSTPTVALDVGALGGMYADSIRLIGTEAGLGVNQQGQIRGGSIHIDQSGHLSHRGTIVSSTENAQSGHLRIKAGSLTNEVGGRLLSDGDLHIDSQQFKDLGTISSGRDFFLTVQDDMTLSQDLQAGRDIHLTSTGTIINAATIQGQRNHSIKAKHVKNRASGKLLGGQRLTATVDRTLNNRGLMNSQGLTHVSVGEGLTNIGSGRIYGDHIALASLRLTNTSEVVGGVTKSAIIAARERLDIGAKAIVNRGQSHVLSLGDFYLGGSLDADQQATGQARHLDNVGSTLESQGSMDLSVSRLDNRNADFQINEKVLVDGPDAFAYISPEGSSARYDYSDYYWASFSRAGKLVSRTTGASLTNFTQIFFNRYTYEDQVSHSEPAKILSGQQLDIRADQLVNDKSFILAGEDLTATVGDFQSIDGQGTRTIEDIGSSQYTHTNWRGGRRRYHERVWHPRRGYRDEQRETITLLAAKRLGNQHDMSQYSGTTPGIDGVGSVRLPNSSLYAVRPDAADYVIETDPAFTHYQRWLGSDYMLNALSRDPEQMHKRMGDGYYEQQLINQQILALTGYRRLSGYNDDESQYKALMDGGIAFAQSLSLRPGIKLSQSHIQRLTRDIVWLETETLTLADGRKEQVLVPKYYRAASTPVRASGTLVSAERLLLSSDGQLNNAGGIAARQSAMLRGQSIAHSGEVSAHSVDLVATDGLVLSGGSVTTVGDLRLAAGGDIELGSTTRSQRFSGDGYLGSRTNVDQVASLSVLGDTGQLSVSSGGHLRLLGSQLVNKGSGKTLLSAAKSLTLGTVETDFKQSTDYDSKNFRREGGRESVGSVIRGTGDIALSSGEQLLSYGGVLASQSGKVSLRGAKGVRLTGRSVSDDFIEHHYDESSNVLSRRSSETVSCPHYGH